MANKKLNAVISIGGAVTSSLRNAIGSTVSGFDKIGSAIDKVKQRQKELNNVISQNEKLGAAGSALKVQYANQELAVINKQIDALKKKQSVIKSANDGIGAGKAMMMGGGMLLGGAIAAALPLAAASKKAGDFEYQLQLIGNTADMTKEQIADLGRKVMATSKATGQSVEDTVRGIGFLVAAGMDISTATETIKQAGQAATASGGDIEDLARAAFTLNDSLKIKAGKDMLLALDTLSQAGKEGNVELKDMAKQLPVLGAGFVSLKMQGREAAATMAAALEVARKGAADADEAANNMKNYIAKIMSPETLKKAKKNFNLDLYKIISDAQKSGKNPFEESMKAIMTATKGDQKAIGELFQDMQVQNFLRPMIQNWEEYKRIKDKALSASGVVDRDAEKMMATQKKQIDAAIQSVTRLAIAVGAVLAPVVITVANAITPVVQGVADFVTNNKALTENIITGVGTVWGLVAAFGAVKTVLGAAVVAFNVLKLAMMTNPIGLALVAIATAAVLIYKNWDPIFDWFSKKIEWLGEKWLKFKAWLGLSDYASIKESAPKPSEPMGGSWSPLIKNSALPSIPKPAERGGTTVHDNSKTEINITQQPGQNSKELAEEVMRQMNQRNAVRGRSTMYDPVTP